MTESRRPPPAHPCFSGLALAKLAESGISPEVATAAGIYSVENAWRDVSAEFAPLPALVFPFFDIDGQPMMVDRDGSSAPYLRVRFLDPRAGTKDGPPKYMSFRRSGVLPYFPRGVGIDWRSVRDNSRMPIVITEGELKALKACSMGVPCVGLSGVDCFSEAAQ